MTNSVFKEKIREFENKVHEECYPDIHFERYENYSGDWGIQCKHSDYSEPCYYTGTFGGFEEKYEKLKWMFQHYVRNNAKYM